jgi:hypothetical protein
MDTLLEFADHKIPFVVVAILTDYPKESPLYPDSAFLQSSGLKLTIHDYYGFFYVSNTSQELMEDVPFLIKAILESSKSKDIPILPLYFDSLKRIYDSELSRRLELISIGEKGPAAR